MQSCSSYSSSPNRLSQELSDHCSKALDFVSQMPEMEAMCFDEVSELRALAEPLRSR